MLAGASPPRTCRQLPGGMSAVGGVCERVCVWGCCSVITSNYYEIVRWKYLSLCLSLSFSCFHLKIHVFFLYLFLSSIMCLFHSLCIFFSPLSSLPITTTTPFSPSFLHPSVSRLLFLVSLLHLSISPSHPVQLDCQLWRKPTCAVSGLPKQLLHTLKLL